ncbi:palmitoyltransferase AKR1-like [Telopea speciosissima]|uniref:palmitoyltransferase AKR1-like n=1 Tax=Telopea speciosissima TaxID=54955 RepID=UPI001CC492FC|nr:palmitoyltransferase AKR1-like [Telopea speciosissima]
MAESTSGSNNLKYGDVYKAAVNGEKVEVLLNFYMQHPISPIINDHRDTVLHVLALNRRTEAAIELINKLPIHLLSEKNCRGNTALHEAARIGALKIAKLMVKKEPRLVNIGNDMEETPLYWAAAYGQTKMFRFFLANITTIDDIKLRRKDGFTILHAAVMGEFYGNIN